eukprot:467044-Rhodomonas_salina.1
MSPSLACPPHLVYALRSHGASAVIFTPDPEPTDPPRLIYYALRHRNVPKLAPHPCGTKYYQHGGAYLGTSRYSVSRDTQPRSSLYRP